MTSANAFAGLCPGCFAEKGSVNICHRCGYDESLKRGSLVLAHRTLLHHGQYLIGKVLGKPGGFGITYLALDTRLDTRVAIKEYLPRDLAGRDGDHATINAHSAEDGEHFRYGLTQFLQEARTLAQFDHANIVRVRTFFEENGTGYLVMDYYDGITLAGYLAQQPQGKLSEKTAVDILMPILDGLREVHAKNFLHRDIKPQNIYLTTDNRAILLDFGAARQAMGERSRSLSVVLSEGYAPYEQYHRRGEQGPWTDIYACAAVLYHAVAGEPPPPATERLHKDELDIAALGLSASLTKALRLGLATDHKSRPQRMKDFQALLLESGDPIKPTTVSPKSPRVDLPAPNKLASSQSVSPTQVNWAGPLWTFALVVTIVIAIAMGIMDDKNTSTGPNIAVPAPPTPTPDVDIALEQEKKRKLLLEKKKAELEKAKAAEEKLQTELQAKKEKEQKTQEDLAKRKAAEEAKKVEVKKQEAEDEAKQKLAEAAADKQLQENQRRIAGLAGATGGADAKGAAQNVSGPSASYGGKVRAKVKPNIVFTGDIAGNPTAEVEVRTALDGSIISQRLIKPSGNKAWDEAVIKAIIRTETMPRDVDGRVPTPMILEFRPRD